MDQWEGEKDYKGESIVLYSDRKNRFFAVYGDKRTRPYKRFGFALRSAKKAIDERTEQDER